MAPQLSCAIARIVGSRSANGAVPPPFPAGAAARPAVPVAALMAAQTRREPRWPQWRPAPPPRDDMRAAAKEQNPAGRRRRAGPDEGQELPYATSAWLGAKRHPEIQSSRTNLNLVYTQVNVNTFLIATLRPHRQEGPVRPADEAGQCPGGSLFEIQGKAGEVTPTSCAGPSDRGSRSGIPVPTDSPAHRMFRLYATKSGPLMIIEA